MAHDLSLRVRARRCLDPLGRGTGLVLLLLFLAAGITGENDYQPPILRVKLGVMDKPVTITGPRLQWQAGEKKGKAGELVLSARGSTVYVNGEAVSLPLRVSGPVLLTIDGYPYRGSLEVLPGSPPLLINHVDVESYVAGVINQEIDSRWPEAAVDAQAVIIRTYALKQREQQKHKAFDLERGVSDQVYAGAALEDARCWAAVERTKGLVLTYQGRLVLPHYHSCCGGRTEVPSAVWGGKDQPWERSVVCPYCRQAPRYFWRLPDKEALSPVKLGSFLGLSSPVAEVKIIAFTTTGRAARIRVKTSHETLEMSGQEFRKRMGYERIRSTWFKVDREDNGFVFRGSGSGHGVGLCQWGARGMALAGFTCPQILSYYYPGTKVIPWNDLAR